jgi:AcrR family transcriptional regulator
MKHAQALHADKPRQRRDEVNDAAAAVFSEKGYDGASTKDIADRLGLQQGSVYYYFPSKEAALLEVCLKGVDEHVRQLELIMSAPMPGLEKLDSFILRHISATVERRDYVRVFLRDRFRLPKPGRRKVGALARRYETMVEGILRQAGLEGSLRTALDLRLMALSLLDLCNAATRWYEREGLTPEQIAQHLTDLARKGLEQP